MGGGGFTVWLKLLLQSSKQSPYVRGNSLGGLSARGSWRLLGMNIVLA